MSRTDVERLRDILCAIDRIDAHRAAGLPADALRDVTLYGLVVIGEAAGALSAAVRGRAPEVPWHAIVAMRNRVAHEYFGLDAAAVEDVVSRRLPPLRAAVERLLQS